MILVKLTPNLRYGKRLRFTVYGLVCESMLQFVS